MYSYVGIKRDKNANSKVIFVEFLECIKLSYAVLFLILCSLCARRVISLY